MAQLILYFVTNIFEEYIAYVLKLKISFLHTEQKDQSRSV